jgi:5-methylcytosine-specific restriction endonuclease McrA
VGRRRRRIRRARHGVLPLLSVAGFIVLGEPGGAEGALAALGAGLVLSPFVPLMLIGLAESPGALVPSRWRASWRYGRPRPAIHAWLRRLVYAADGYRCVYCGNGGQLQLDHVHPWSYGGRTSFWNLACLCQTCNVIKSNYWISRGGRVAYRPFAGASNMTVAAAILAVERRARWNPMRWIRAATELSR